MIPKDKVLVIASGGTIVSPKKGGAAAPDENFSDAILGRAKEFFDAERLRVKAVRPFGAAGIDSSDMGPVQWVRLAAEISMAYSQELRGVLIIHGTDTMAYTAAWLSICFPGASFPIILTGSQQSPDDLPFDGENNLLGAAQLVSCGARRTGIFFDWKFYAAMRAHKADCEAIDAYRSIGGGCLTYHEALRNADSSAPVGEGCPANLEDILKLDDETIAAAAQKVALCLALPGVLPCVRGDEEVLIAVGYGTGNMPVSYHDILKNIYGGRKPYIIACSQAEEGLKKPDAYKNVGIGGLTELGFTVFNQGAVTLEYITALANYAVLSGDPAGVLAAHLQRL